MAVRLSVGTFPGLAAPTGVSKLRHEWNRRHWGALHRRVASQPVFAGCSRQEVRSIVRWGDEVTVEPGAVLWNENTIGYHFVVVESGELALTHEDHAQRTLRRGEFAGEVAILGFGPQTASLVATTACRLFVIGRAQLLSLVHTTGVRTGLFGEVDEHGARERIRKLRADGHEEWLRRFPVTTQPERVAMPDSLHFKAARPSPAPPRWLPQLDRVPTRASLPVTASRRFRIAVAAIVSVAVLSAAVAVATTARPPVGVVSAAAPIDVADDFVVRGAMTSPINGHFVLTAVRITRPTYAALIGARFRHDTTARLATDQVVAQQASQNAFRDAKNNAVRAVALALVRDPATLDVAIEPLDVGGSSVALVYALALVDLMDPADLARGRTIAATGELDAAGRVGAVRFVEEKLRVAQAAGASVFFVPRGQAPRDAPMQVVEVATLADAVAALRAMNG